MLSKTATAVVVGVITLVWAANFILGATGHPTNGQIDGIFSAIVGGVLGIGVATATTSKGTTGTDAAATDSGTGTAPAASEGNGTQWTSSPSQPGSPPVTPSVSSGEPAAP